MKITVKHWLTEPHCDIRRYKTTVTVMTAAVTLAVTLDGNLKRKDAVRRAADTLDPRQWSPSFIRQVWDGGK